MSNHTKTTQFEPHHLRLAQSDKLVSVILALEIWHFGKKKWCGRLFVGPGISVTSWLILMQLVLFEGSL